uniref:Rotatin N-terminal domain-containing protein n=1 Tax=Tetradesmus obliquus TaxID=3088 RepID=A0A383WNT2_TETOB|eukprot:jgi/Sobl393_1/13804/SZX78923.1
MERAGHHSADVRGRALESLEFKWKYGLVSAADLLQERRVLKGLLGLLNIGDGAQTTAVVLLLLRKMAAADAKLARALLELGALQQLHAFTGRTSSSTSSAAGGTAAASTGAPHVFITPRVWPDELLPSVEALVAALLTPGAPSSSTSSSSAAASQGAAALTDAPGERGRLPAPHHGSPARGQQQPGGALQSSAEASGGSPASKSAAAATAAATDARSGRLQQLISAAGTSRLRTSSSSWASTAAALQGQDPAAVHTHLVHGAAGAGSSRPASSVGSPAAAGNSPGAGSGYRVQAAAAAWSHAGAAHSPASHQGLSRAAAGSRPGTSSSAAAAAAAAAAGVAASGTWPQGNSPTARSAAAGAAGGSGSDVVAEFDERLLRARARADWRQQESRARTAAGADAAPVSAWAPPPSSSRHPGHVLLPVVALSASDDQALFELNVRLQYSDDERLLLPALLELGGAVALDMPAEALLQRQSILDNCLALLSSSRSSRAVQQAAAAVLLQLVTGLKASLALASHPELAHSEYGDGLASSTAAAAAGVAGAQAGQAGAPAAAAAAGGSSDSSRSFLAAARLAPGGAAAAAALAAARAPVLDPSCPNCYPQLLMPDEGMFSSTAAAADAQWRLAGAALLQQQQCVDVTSAVNSTCLQVCELLAQPGRHYELLPILEVALPLLTAPFAALAAAGIEVGSNSSEQHQQQPWDASAAAGLLVQSSQLQEQEAYQLHDELRAVWRGMLGALSRALASTAAIAAGDRAAALAAALSGQPVAAAAAANCSMVAGDAAAVLLAAAGAASDAAPAAAVMLARGAAAAPGLCCWDVGSLNLLLLALRLINAAPPAWCSSSVVPPSIADAAAAAATDQAIALLLPELRPAAQPLLQRLQPASLQALQTVQAVHVAAAAAEEAAGPLLLQLQAEPAKVAARWMGRVLEAVPSLGFNPRSAARLLQAVMHGLTVVASVRGGQHQQQAGQLLVKLLSQQQQQQQVVLQLLASAAAAVQQPVVQLLMLPQVTEYLVVQGLAEQHTRPQSCSIMLSLLQGVGLSAAAAWLVPWRCWISCCAGDESAPALAEALEGLTQQQLQQQQQFGGDEFGGPGFWQSPALCVLQDLFSVRADVRRAAGQQLLRLLLGGEEQPEEELDEFEAFADDPFKGLLDSASAALAALGRQQQQHHHLPLDPLTDASAALAANFTQRDVRNLLAVLQNQGLALELRRSAAEELLALSPEPQLLGVMVEPQHLEAVWGLCVPSWPEDDAGGAQHHPGRAATPNRVGAGAPSGELFDMQLAVSALQLLAGLLARSPQALAWMFGDTHRLLVPLLPLVVHTLHSVRRAVSRVLALTVFGNAAQQWSGFAAAAAAAAADAAAAAGLDTSAWSCQQQQQNGQQQQAVLLPGGVGGVLLPEPFLRQYKFPFKVLPVSVAASMERDSHHPCTLDEPSSEATGHQQQRWVKQLVEQQQLLQLAGNSPAAARAMLADCLPPAATHISQAVLSATANQVFNVDAAAVAQRLLAAVQAAASHAECEQALHQLEQLASSQQGLQAIAATGNTHGKDSQHPAAGQDCSVAACGSTGCGWLSAFDRLLGAAPINSEDQRLWLRLLQLLERMLAAAPLAEGQYTHLQLLLQQSVSAWLQQPAASKEVPRPPLALAMGTNSWELLKQQPSSAAAAAAVADVFGLSTANSKDAAAVATAVTGSESSSERLLALQVSRQALRVLLQLVKAVKHSCCHVSNGSTAGQTSGASLATLQPAELLQLLCNSLLARGDEADYCCRVAAGVLLYEVTGALQDSAQVARLQHARDSRSSSDLTSRMGKGRGLKPAADAALAAAGPGSCGVGLSEEASAVVDAIEPLITKVLMPVAGRSVPGFRGKALVKTALQALLEVVRGPVAAQEDWSQVWAAIGGTFWLSRLCRDRESCIRCLALRLLGQLLAPGAAATQSLIAHSWPDCGHRLVRVALDTCEAHGVRAAAMRALAASMVIPVSILQQQQQQQGAAGDATGDASQPPKQLPCLGLGPLLKLDQLWSELVPGCLLNWQQRPAKVAAAAAALAATAMAAAPDSIGRALLLQQGVAAAVLQLAAVPLHDGSSRAPTPADEQQQLYVQQLQLLGLVEDAQSSSSSSSSSLLPPPALHSCRSVANAAAGQHIVATLALQQQAACAASAAAAARMLALAAAPASAGGGLLLLPAAVQSLLREVPVVLLQLICRVGNVLVVPQGDAGAANSSSRGQVPGAATAAVLQLLQQQLALVHVAAAAVLASPLASLAAGQREQQLLQLLAAVDQQPGAADGSSAPSVSSTNTSTSSSRGQLLVAIAACMSHPASSRGLQLLLVQLLGLLLSSADVAAAALGLPAAAQQSPGSAAEAEADGSQSSAGSSDSSSSMSAQEHRAAPATTAEPKCASGVPVCAALCRELAVHLPGSILSPAAAPGAPDAADAAPAGSTTPTVASPEGLAAVFALQNLLTYSRSAKEAALEIGLHKLLMEAAKALAAAVAAAAPAAGSAQGPGAAAGQRRVRARWFSSTPAAAPKAAPAAGVAFGRKGAATGAAAAAAAAGGVRRAAGPKAPGAAVKSRQQQQQAAQLRLRGNKSSSSDLADTAADAAAEGDDGPAEPQEQAADAAEDAVLDMSAAGADAAGDNAPAEDACAEADTAVDAAHPGAAVVSSGSSRQQQQAALRTVNLRKLLLNVLLLRHLAYRCHDTQAALVASGLVELLQQLWPLALQQTPLLLELLQLLDNMLPGCYQARLAVAAAPSSTGSTLLQQLLLLLLPSSGLTADQNAPSSSAAAAQAAAGVPDVVRGAGVTLLHYASSDDGAAQLVRPGGTFLQDVQRALRSCLLSCKREHEPQQQKQAQQQRLAGTLQLLAVVAGRPHGQRALLRPTVAPALIDLVAEVITLPQQPAAVSAALLLLRNLAFDAELRGPVLANQQLLPLLLAAAECVTPRGQQQQQQLNAGGLGRPGSSSGQGNAQQQGWAPLYGKPVTSAAASSSSRPGSPGPAGTAGSGSLLLFGSGLVPSAAGNACCAAYAVSALWALMYQGEKVKAAVRKLPAAAARLAAVRDCAQQLLEEAEEQQIADKAAAGVGSSRGDIAAVSDRDGWEDQQRAAAAAGKGVAGRLHGKAVVAAAGSLAGARDAAWWLEQLAESCSSVLDIMESA